MLTAKMFEALVNLYREEKYDEITDIEMELQNIFENQESENFIIEDMEDWIMNFRWPEEGETLITYVSCVSETDGEDNHYFPEKMTDLYYLKESILLIWADILYSNQELPANVARMLVDEGTCSGSQWMEELRAFAAA